MFDRNCTVEKCSKKSVGNVETCYKHAAPCQNVICKNRVTTLGKSMCNTCLWVLAEKQDEETKDRQFENAGTVHDLKEWMKEYLL